jgi:hypothetical protein
MKTISNTGKTNQNKRSVSETGHAKNIANFQDLISFCQGYGTTYNPSRQSLTIADILSQYQTAIEKLHNVKSHKTGFDYASNDRRNEFEGFRPFTTRILNAFIVSGADKLAIEDAKGINKKIKGIRATPKKETEDPEKETPKTISTAQQSYDRLIDHFANLIQLLQQSNYYSPNEEDLKLTALQNKMANMQAKNTQLIDAYTQYSNAIIERNQILYDPLTGMVQIAKEIKLYIKSIYGAKSPQYKQISGLEFKIIRK